jgi:hypothetical protein
VLDNAAEGGQGLLSIPTNRPGLLAFRPPHPHHPQLATLLTLKQAVACIRGKTAFQIGQNPTNPSRG